MSAAVYIGLGSNLAQPSEQILLAVATISQLKDSTVSAVSSLYQTPPMGPQDQPYYVNAVLELQTTLRPLPLLHHLQAIETKQGRTRDTGRWGARTLDLDILLYSGETSTDPVLTLPHPGIALRSFVLYPLNEIAPQLDITGLGSPSQLIERLAEPCPSIINAKNLEIAPSVC